MFDGRFRQAVDRSTRPVGHGLSRASVSPDLITASGLVFAVGTALLVASGHFLTAVAALALTGTCDLIDGPVARASGRMSVRGAFFDSVTDRVADAVLYGGFAAYLINHKRGDVALLPVAVLGVAGLISYQRAKAEIFGISARGGLMERAERFVAFGLCLLIGAWAPSELIASLWVFLALVSATAIGRFLRVWDAAGRMTPSGDSQLASNHAQLRDRHLSTSVQGDRVVDRPVESVDVQPEDVQRVGPVIGFALTDDASSATRARWRKGRVDSRWRSWREVRSTTNTSDSPGEGDRERRRRTAGVRRSGEPHGRWRSRRATVMASRSGRVWRDRRAERSSRSRSYRRSGGR